MLYLEEYTRIINNSTNVNYGRVECKANGSIFKITRLVDLPPLFIGTHEECKIFLKGMICAINI